MDLLPNDILVQTPSTYRCWVTMRGVCVGFSRVFAGDYHRARGYSFTARANGRTDLVDYHDFTLALDRRLKDGALFLCQSYHNEEPVWFDHTGEYTQIVYHESSGDFYAINGNSLPDMTYDSVVHRAEHVRVVLEFFYYEFPALFRKFNVVQAVSAADWMRNGS
jgi:hypothetical protein